MIKTHVLGFPRIGEQRELKFALEHYWQGKSDAKALLTTAQRIRQKQWLEQQDAGLDFVTVGDFALYDQMANHIQWFGCVPERFNTGSPNQDSHPLQTYFEMARGGRQGQPPLEMTKWFDTNYHYLVPEFDEATRFKLQADSLFDEVKEATRLGLPVKVSLIGPVTFLYLGKEKQTDFDRLSLLESLLPIYSALLKQLHALGVHWVQVDEPILGLDLPGQWAMAFERAYHALHALGPQLLLATYFSELQGHLSLACRLPVAGLHIDAVRGESEIAHLADWLPTHKVLSLGLIDGRNIWRTDLDHALKTIEQLQRKWTGTVWLAPSCSLLHVPYGFGSDQVVNPEVKPWLAGAYEKLLELNTLKIACNQGADGDASIALAQQRLALQSRRNSRLVHRLAVDERINNLPADADRRTQPFAARKAIQANRLQLPPYPTTTIGSFPQTAAIRQVRAAFKRGDITRATYEHAIQADIERAVRTQEALGLDVLVHGEAERNDMVEYFGEQLEGYTFSENGWVQSYGSRCVKPPIIYGDVSRPTP